MDPSTYAMMQSMRAEKAVVKSEHGGCDTPGATVSSAKKRKAANYASFSLDHARRLQDELAKVKAELAEAKQATAAEVKSAKEAAVQEFLGSKGHEPGW
ncbi:hypothetical protein EJB05_45980, partial [Eragrostis curvula]